MKWMPLDNIMRQQIAMPLILEMQVGKAIRGLLRMRKLVGSYNEDHQMLAPCLREFKNCEN